VAGNPDVTYKYNRRGLPTNVVDLAGTHNLSYYLTNSIVDTETNTAGVLSGLAVHHHYDSNLRRDYLEVLGSLQTVKHQYEYDTASRMSKVYENTNTHVTYVYHTNSSLLQTVTFRSAGSNGAVVMTRTDNYDYLNRLKDTTSAASNIFSFAYQYNSANQRTRVTREDSSYWSYGYDDLGQVTNAAHLWSDGGVVAGQQFEYTFDDIGNRKTAASGGNEWGTGLRYAYYSANNLDQYTSRSVPPYADVLGAARTNATVAVNNTPSYRKGEYFRAEVPINNSNHLYVSLTNVAVLQNGTNSDITVTNSGYVYIPKSTQTFSYDVDGNLTNDGRWTYVWDDENRLISMTSSNLANVAGNLRLEFEYDYGSRRIAKREYDVNGQVLLNQRFTYDQWNVLAELNLTNNAIIRKYLWGLDLSGTLHDAVGVGGLLVINDVGAGALFPTCDGNGNVSTLVNALDSSTSATYEYSPFGELIRANGAMAKSNPFRSHTRYADEDSDLSAYGHRYYSPSSGRWISRDPLEGWEDISTYCFVYNSPLVWVDPDGLAPDGWTGGDYKRQDRPDPTSPSGWRDSGGKFMKPPGNPGSGSPLAPPGSPRSAPGGPTGSGTPAGAAAAALDEAAQRTAAGLEQFLLNSYIDKGIKECLSKSTGSSCVNCCLINLYLVKGKFDRYRNLFYSSSQFFPKSCLAVKADMAALAGEPAVEPDFRRYEYEHSWIERLVNPNKSNKIAIDDQFYVPRYIDLD
jgi:RHS repeat-associated protein